ncbi:hypothetical protein HLH33_17625 [Gluconacetobacter diazotrophicus]|uniref:CobQ/CobB/MinD/ParA nucleotide binding domain-containing protein n=1 Tax=Gluconacetobacter diazotrophicus TaxID=33996 RepID=A0A7W4I892_GLUDI|nr:hypothetical protein [Gluconacetobacter diazotrophicus]MBB2158093.1 hypothetical protein [Gluconacetobacter diazotrophicus]
MSDKTTPPKAEATRTARAVWRIGRGRIGGSTTLALFTRWAIEEGRGVLAADGDPNNPMLSRMFPPEGPNGVERPESAGLEASKVWLSAALAEAVTKKASIVIDMGGGDRVGEEMAAEADVGVFLKENGIRPTFVYFTGPERDDFDHVFRIWESNAFRDGDTLLVLNAGLSRSATPKDLPFAWLDDEPRFERMVKGGVRTAILPALTCMKYFEADNMTVFDVFDGKKRPDGSPVNLLWAHMANKWRADFKANLSAAGVTAWLP